MPFDATPITETKLDVFSLEGLVAWLETQDPATTFNYMSATDCLLCRYFKAQGYRVYALDRNGFVETGTSANLRYPGEMADACNNQHVRESGRTYGAVLSIASKLLAAS